MRFSVSMFEVSRARGERPGQLSSFDIEAKNHDAAKRATLKKIKGLGRRVRSLSFSSMANAIIVYVFKEHSK